jgi:hypothetical protein
MFFLGIFSQKDYWRFYHYLNSEKNCSDILLVSDSSLFRKRHIWVLNEPLAFFAVQRRAGRPGFDSQHCKNCKIKHLLTYGAEPVLRSCKLCSYSRTSQHFKEPEGSSPCSKEPSTGPYPEPDRSSPYHPIPSYLSKIYFNIVHPPT